MKITTIELFLDGFIEIEDMILDVDTTVTTIRAGVDNIFYKTFPNLIAARDWIRDGSDIMVFADEN